jgi:hypothetical protein
MVSRLELLVFFTHLSEKLGKLTHCIKITNYESLHLWNKGKHTCFEYKSSFILFSQHLMRPPIGIMPMLNSATNARMLKILHRSRCPPSVVFSKPKHQKGSLNIYLQKARGRVKAKELAKDAAYHAVVNSHPNASKCDQGKNISRKSTC